MQPNSWTTLADGRIEVTWGATGLTEVPLLAIEERSLFAKDVVAAHFDVFARYAAAEGIPLAFLHSFDWSESKGNDRAYRLERNGWTGIGAFQLTHPGVKKGYSDEALYDIELNTKLACGHLRACMALAGRDIVKVGAVYNWGHLEADPQSPWRWKAALPVYLENLVRALNTFIVSQQSADTIPPPSASVDTAKVMAENEESLRESTWKDIEESFKKDDTE